MNLFKKFLAFLVLVITFSYCADSNNVEEELEEEEEQVEIIYSTVAPFYPIDFESEGNGAEWTWTVFENESNTMLEVIANPYKEGRYKYFRNCCEVYSIA